MMDWKISTIIILVGFLVGMLIHTMITERCEIGIKETSGEGFFVETEGWN